MTRPVESSAYHRNGVGGAGFYVGLVRDEEAKSMMLVVVFDQLDDGAVISRKTFNERVAVLDVDLAANGDIGFGVNSWRGADDFQEEARAIMLAVDPEHP